ncbi:RING finger protein 227 [Polymixia lowei]
MFSELECGICFQSYNAGRRCPRELQCKHSFCESCLVSLCRQASSDTSIVCPLCRRITTVSGEEKLRAALRVDESVLELMVAAGVLEDSEADDDVKDECEVNRGETLPESPAEGGDSSSGLRGGRFRRSWKRMWAKITGDTQRGRTHCMTDDDIRDLAMMSCYMF